MSCTTYTRLAVSSSLWPAGLFMLCIASGLHPLKLYAQTSSNQGRIEINSASLRNSGTGWQLAAIADIRLSPEMRQGLNSGVALEFIANFRIKRTRTYWLDETVVEYQYRYSLIYYELTRHYRLQSLTNGESGNYRSLIAALDKLGRLQGLVVPIVDELDNSAALYGQLNLRLDDNALPLPLQPLLSSTWKLASEDFAWSLN